MNKEALSGEKNRIILSSRPDQLEIVRAIEKADKSTVIIAKDEAVKQIILAFTERINKIVTVEVEEK